MKLTVDGVCYTVFVESVRRTGVVKESKVSGDLKSGTRFRDIVGTYYHYELSVATDRLSPTEYDALYDVLTSPTPSHAVALPYGRNGVLEFDAYIEQVNDDLLADHETERVWGNLTIKFKAKAPQRRPI